MIRLLRWWTLVLNAAAVAAGLDVDTVAAEPPLAYLGQGSFWQYLAAVCRQPRHRQSTVTVVVVEQLLTADHWSAELSQQPDSLAARLPTECPFRHYRRIDADDLINELRAEPEHQFHHLLLVVDVRNRFRRSELESISRVYLACDTCLPPVAVATEPGSLLEQWLDDQLPGTDHRFRCTVLAGDQTVIHMRPVLDGCRLWQGILMPRTESHFRALSLPQRCDLNGTLIRIAVNDFNPFCDLLDKESKLRFGPSIDYELVRLLAEKYNFRYELINANQDWGVLRNGTWTGSIGYLVNGSCDMAVCCISQTEARYRAVDFSHFTVMDEIAFIASAPGLHSRRWLIVQPFEWSLWLCNFASLVLLATVLITVARHGGHRRPLGHSRPAGRSDTESGRICLRLCAMLLSRSTPVPPGESSPVRLLYLSWMVAVLVLSTAYCSAYYSMLTLPVLEEPLDTLRDLERAARTDSRRIDALQSGSFESFFADSLPDQGIFHVISEHIKRTRHGSVVTELEAAFDLMHSDPNFVLIDTRLGLEFMRKTYALKPLRIGFESLGMDSMANAFPKRSNLFGPFDHYIRLAQHTGLFQYWTQRLFLFSAAREPEAFAAAMQANRAAPPPPDQQSLVLGHLSSAFLLWALGLATGCLALAFELLLFSFINCYNDKMNLQKARH